jgi:glucokinase-like ROK family protein
MTPPLPKRTIELRQTNRQAILRFLMLDGPMSRLELSQKTGLSLGTITNVAGPLQEIGMLVETGMEESEGGRPRSILGINPQYGFLVGVDMGEHHVELELFELTLKKLGTVRRPLNVGLISANDYVSAISSGLEELCRVTGISQEKILGMGIGVPGIVEHDGQVSISIPMWNWKSVQFLRDVEDRINLPVYLDNGAKAMALAEFWYGAGRGAQDVVVALIGTGIGAGVITKGSLYRGATNSAGEWGHTKIVMDGKPCRCGSHGCLEAYAGATGILNRMGVENINLTSDQVQIDMIEQLVRDEQQGDEHARYVLRETAHYLGAGVANLVNLFNPERVVVGGWVGMLIGESIMADLKEYVRQYALPPSQSRLEIVSCQFGQDAICTGAACLVIEQYLSANPKFARRLTA